MLWCNPPPLFRRSAHKKSYSDFTFAKKANLSRGDSKQSEKCVRVPHLQALIPQSDLLPPRRTLVDFTEHKELKYTKQYDVLLIDTPSPPPKEPRSRGPPPPALKRRSKSVTNLREKPLPVPVPQREREPAEDESEPVFPWYRRRLCTADDASSRYTPAQPALLPRSDFALSVSGSSNTGLNLVGGLVNDRAKNDVYSLSAKDLSVTRQYTTGDHPPPRFGHASASAGSVVVVWGGDTMSASSNQIRARAKYDNGLYFLNLGES